ncbi:hypothetical protein ACFTAO_35370 [Paenibacillus rhizoplanae]
MMADKLAEVTRCVEEHIGLKMDDFTRAVVLPQGKFAEFLSLRGVDRRQMLQRLFHLEQYGDGLALKLSRRVKENEAALRALEAEQQGAGQRGQGRCGSGRHPCAGGDPSCGGLPGGGSRRLRSAQSASSASASCRRNGPAASRSGRLFWPRRSRSSSWSRSSARRTRPSGDCPR